MAVSQIARRFYRQGNNWAIQNVELFVYPGQPAGAGLLTVQKIQDTWMSSNAWHKGFANWVKMQKEYGLDSMPSIKPKYNDFKIFFNKAHYDDWKANVDAGGTGQQDLVSGLGTLTPVDLTNAYALPGEWVPSQFVVPATGGATNAEYHITMHGADTAAHVGLITNYQDSRSTPQEKDPETSGASSANVYTAMFDEGTVQSAEVVSQLLYDNDELPYAREEYPGADGNFTTGQIVLWDGITSTNNTGAVRKLHTGPFNAQCGLIQINNAVVADVGSVPLNVYAVLTLVPGNERGYLTQKMQDV